MDVPSSDLQAIRQLLADLTTRINRIERQLGIPSDSKVPPHTEAQAPAPPPPTQASAAVPPPASVKPSGPAELTPFASLPQSPSMDPGLESRIASHWFNRIGIVAVLVGISYFLKFAFENNWIGPAGRVSIGLLAGIAIVIWSERFRTKGYKAFSYSLKAVGIGTLYLSLWAAF